MNTACAPQPVASSCPSETPPFVDITAVELLVHLARHPSIEKDSLPTGSGNDDDGTGAAVSSESALKGNHVKDSFRASSPTHPSTPNHSNPSTNAASNLPVVRTNSDAGSRVAEGAISYHIGASTEHGHGHGHGHAIATTAVLPHQQFLTAPHMRSGKGGRKPSIDPRLDPNVDPKKAKRILANRLSAAKSTLKRKRRVEALRCRIDGLGEVRGGLERELMGLELALVRAVAVNASLRNGVWAEEADWEGLGSG